jgi:plasmid stabilization system protein ParE
MTTYRFTSAALAELKEATLYYEEKENGLGGIFLDEVDATVARILANPHAWHPLSPRTRRCRTHRFPFGLIYQIRSDEILVTSVMDLRRDPTRWKELL